MSVKINECVKNCSSKVDTKMFLIIILLIVMCVMQFRQNKKIEQIYNYFKADQTYNTRHSKSNRIPRKKFIDEIKKDFFNNLNKDMREMDLLKERIQNEMNMYFNNNSNEKVFNEENSDILNIKEEYNKDKKSYIVEVNLSKDFNENYIETSIHNCKLYLKISKNIVKNANSESSENEFSLLKVLNLPKTQAKTKDIKKVFENSKLTITVPII